MCADKRLFKAIVYDNKTKRFGKRVTIKAADIDEASEILNLEYGKDNYIDLHNEEFANKPR